MKSLVLLLLLVLPLASAVEWDTATYPNPTKQASAQQCGLRSAGHLCDPDGILNESERYRLNHELQRLEARTHQEFGRDFCERKGLTAVILLAKNVKGGTEQDVRRMATDLRQRWNLDEQCQKGLVILVAVEDRKFWVSRDARVPVYADEFSRLLQAQQENFRAKQYPQGLANIIQGTADAAVGKQGQLPPPPQPPAGPDGGRGRGGAAGGGGGSGFPSLKMPPLWVILAIVLVVIPLLLCCCCMYFCFCRGRTVGNRRQSASDDPEAAGARAGGGGGGNRLREMLGGAGGGALMSLVQSCFQNRGRAQQPPHPDQPDRGDYVPPRPVAEEGKGLYPAKPVEDPGAGGSW